ncbi:HEPN domain-containing protein [Hymenobacter sp. 5516J-16]|uniref:HEPN domain-containing protein n=1 Tax=Hymenobacter sp. 5516J-16 TaxID=2932253 RepID=UPI00397D0B9D
MTKQDHVNYWKETAEQDWSSAQALLVAGNYLNSLFFAHLVIEKLSKALWVQENVSDHPREFIISPAFWTLPLWCYVLMRKS